MTEVLDQAKIRSSARRGLLAGGAGMIAIKGLNAVLGFAIVAVFARFLPPENYGVYVLAITVSQFLALPLQMGLPTLLNREIAIGVRRNDLGIVKGLQIWSQRAIAWGTLVLGGLVVAGYGVALQGSWSGLQDTSWPMILMIVALMPVIAEMKRAMGILSGFRRVFESRMADGVVRPALLLAMGWLSLSLFDIGPTGLLAVYIGAGFVGMLFAWWRVRLAQPEGLEDVQAELKGAEWRQALLPLTAFAAAGMIKTYSDILMLGAMTDTTSVAIYRVASQIGALALIVQTVANAMIAPRVAAAHAAGDRVEVQHLVVLTSRISFVCTALGAVALAIWGTPAINLAFGDGYSEVYATSLVLAFGLALSAFFGGSVTTLNMAHQERASSRFAWGTAAANVVLNLALIPFLGALGAALATVITTLIMQLLAWSRVRKVLGYRTDALGPIR